MLIPGPGAGGWRAIGAADEVLEYAPRVFQRMAEDPGLFHNFPRLVDNEILQYGQRTVMTRIFSTRCRGYQQV